MSATGTRITERGEYLKRVLAPAVKDGSIPDIFARYALAPTENDATVIAQQLDFVVKLWRNTTDHAKYGELVRRLLKEHPESERVLRDAAARAAARQAVLAGRRAADRAGEEEFAALIADLRDGSGALPESARQRLLDTGTDLGLSSAQVTSHLQRERFVDDIGASRPTLEEAKFRAIQDKLRSLRTLAGTGDAGLTLFSVIGAPVSANRAQLQGAFATAQRENDKRRVSDEKSARNRVLTDARLYLVESDPELYRNALVNFVKEQLRERMRRRRQVQDALDVKAFRSFVADAVRLGLDEQWAQTAVRELARTERMPIEPEHGRPTDGGTARATRARAVSSPPPSGCPAAALASLTDPVPFAPLAAGGSAPAGAAATPAAEPGDE